MTLTVAAVVIAASLIYYVVRFSKHHASGRHGLDAVRATVAEESKATHPDGRRKILQPSSAPRTARRHVVPARERADVIQALRAEGMTRSEAFAEEKRRRTAA